MTATQLSELEPDQEIEVPLNAYRLALPDNHVLLAEGEEDEDGKVKKKPRFKMQVNSGIPMSHWWFGQLAVNLSGITWNGKNVAALLDHDVTKRVGYTTKLYIDDGEGLIAEGIMLSNEHAQSVRADSAEGFPFQASCYLVATKHLQLEEGAEHEVNGHTITGPAMIFEASELREVTMCALGADPNTSSDASLSAEGQERVRVPLSVKVSTMTQQNEPTPAQPAAPEVDAEAVALEAANAATERVNFILELAADCQTALAKKLIKDGVSKEQAALALAKDLRERDAQAAPVMSQTQQTAPLSAPAASQEGKQDATLSMPEGEDKWKQQWASDETIRREFGDNEGVWLSYNRNKHRCKNYGSRSAFEGKGVTQ